MSYLKMWICAEPSSLLTRQKATHNNTSIHVWFEVWDISAPVWSNLLSSHHIFVPCSVKLIPASLSGTRADAWGQSLHGQGSWGGSWMRFLSLAHMLLFLPPNTHQHTHRQTHTHQHTHRQTHTARHPGDVNVPSKPWIWVKGPLQASLVFLSLFLSGRRILSFHIHTFVSSFSHSHNNLL